MPTAINCGTWISGVEVTDADTARVVWSGEAIEDEDGNVTDVGRVVLGVLPARDWREVAALADEPAPLRWRFMVETYGDSTTIFAPVSGDPGTVYRPGGTESLSRFNDHTCTGLPFSSALARRIVLVAALLVVLVAVFTRMRSSTGGRKAPAGAVGDT